MNYNTTGMSAAEEKEVAGLIVRNRDIYDHGAEVLAKQAVKEELHERRQAWVTANRIACFSCGATITEWAAGGRNQWGKFWAICVRCVRKPKEKEAGSESTF